jgi:hypothetical protein
MSVIDPRTIMVVIGFMGVASQALLCGSNTVVLTNDHRGHAAVLALFDEAMAGM